MTTFERQRTGGSFVAYEKRPTKTPMPILVGDQPEKAHLYPEVFIREYPSIKVKALAPSDSGSGLAVQFDPESVPVPEGKPQLRRPINANTTGGGDIEKALRWALDHNEPLYLAIEYRRKYRNSSREVIPYDTPIMTLRGCDDNGNPTESSQGASRENISKVLAVIGPVSQPDRTMISDEVRSDPMTWPSLRSNRIGATPPLEWVRITRPDGTAGGAAVPKAVWAELTGANQGGANLDDAALARIADAVARRLGATSDDPTMTRPPQRTGRSAEGRRWDAFNSDGRVNPGSYAVSSLLEFRDTALTALGDSNYAEAAAADAARRPAALLTADQISAAATTLMSAFADVADQVQTSVTHKPANRIDSSYNTVRKVLRQIVLRDLPLTVQIVGDSTAMSEWLATITDAASALVAAVMEQTEHYLAGVAEPTPINDASGRAQRQSSRQNQPVDPRPSAAPANRDVQAPPEPDFSVGDAASAPVASVTDRNKATLGPILAMVDGLTPQGLMPLLHQIFGTADLEQIDPDRLTAVTQAWKEDVQTFTVKAREAYKAHQPTTRTA